MPWSPNSVILPFLLRFFISVLKICNTLNIVTNILQFVYLDWYWRNILIIIMNSLLHKNWNMELLLQHWPLKTFQRLQFFVFWNVNAAINGCLLRNLKPQQLYSNAEKHLPLLNRHSYSVTIFPDAWSVNLSLRGLLSIIWWNLAGRTTASERGNTE